MFIIKLSFYFAINLFSNLMYPTHFSHVLTLFISHLLKSKSKLSAGHSGSGCLLWLLSKAVCVCVSVFAFRPLHGCRVFVGQNYWQFSLMVSLRQKHCNSLPCFWIREFALLLAVSWHNRAPVLLNFRGGKKVVDNTAGSIKQVV